MTLMNLLMMLAINGDYTMMILMAIDDDDFDIDLF